MLIADRHAVLGREKTVEIKADGRHEHHMRAVYRPWGGRLHRRGRALSGEAYYSSREGRRCRYHHRAEHWVGGGDRQVTINGGEVKHSGEAGPSIFTEGRPAAEAGEYRSI